MKKLFIVITVLLAFVSCIQEEYYYIPRYQKPVIQNKDRVYFVNHQDNSLVDTFVINRNEYRRYADVDYNKRHYNECVDLRYVKENTPFSFDFSYYQSPSGVTISASKKENNASYTANTIETEIIIKGTTYTVFAAGSYSPPFEFPRIVYYSYKEGILRYDYSDTSYYEIKK